MSRKGRAPQTRVPTKAEAAAHEINAATQWLADLALHLVITPRHIEVSRAVGVDLLLKARAFERLCFHANGASTVATRLLAIASGVNEEHKMIDNSARVLAALAAVTGTDDNGWQWSNPDHKERALLHFKEAFDVSAYVQPVLDSKMADLKAWVPCAYMALAPCPMWPCDLEPSLLRTSLPSTIKATEQTAWSHEIVTRDHES